MLAFLDADVFELAVGDLVGFEDMTGAGERDAVFSGVGDDVGADSVLGGAGTQLNGIAGGVVDLIGGDDVFFVEAGLFAVAPEMDAGAAG